MSSLKITYEDKEAVNPPGIRKNQAQDADFNEIKDVVNSHADSIDISLLKSAANLFKFVQKGFGNNDLENNQVGDIFCGWRNDGLVRYSEAIWNGGALSDSNNFTPLVQTEI